MTEQVLARLDALAANLGVATAHLWEVLVRQALIDALGYAFLAGAFVVAVILLSRLDIDDREASFCRWLAVGAAGMLVSAFVWEAAGRFFNPEFYAAKYITEFLIGG